MSTWFANFDGREVLTQIQFKPTAVSIGGTFIVLLGYFLGKGW